MLSYSKDLDDIFASLCEAFIEGTAIEFWVLCIEAAETVDMEIHLFNLLFLKYFADHVEQLRDEYEVADNETLDKINDLECV